MSNRKEIIEELLHSIHAMRHQLWGKHSGSKKHIDITPAQGFALRYIASNKTASVKEIAEALHVTSSAATQLIDVLAEKDYVIRKEDENDRRSVTLSLSSKATQLFEEFKAQGVSHMVELLAPLSDEELAKYADLTKKIAASIKSQKS
jgi:DNA-binding MarR family transcriptional regulator